MTNKENGIGRVASAALVGQVVARLAEDYVTPYADQSIAPVMGQPASRILNGGVGLLGFALAQDKNVSASNQLLAAIFGSRLLCDSVLDGMKGILTPTAPAVRLKRITPTRSMSQPILQSVQRDSYSSWQDGLIRVD